LIGGVDTPTRGEIQRNCRVSWPLGLTGGLQPMLTGRQNAKFICRIHGAEEEELRDRIAFVHDFSDLETAFDEPIRTYSSGMRARLSFALSLAFKFDMYLIDEVMSVGDAAFRVKSRKAFDDLAKRAGLILVSHSDATMKSFCDAAIWLHEGRVLWFDSVSEAITEYNKHSIPE
jgi:capsular polysaccharide transport system ATP-binding protein